MSSSMVRILGLINEYGVNDTGADVWSAPVKQL